MVTKRLKTKIYKAPGLGELRRMRCPSGVSFKTASLQELEKDSRPVSVEVELIVTNQPGMLLITMRKVARRPDSWYCSSASLLLPPRAATDLIQSLTSLRKRLKP